MTKILEKLMIILLWFITLLVVKSLGDKTIDTFYKLQKEKIAIEKVRLAREVCGERGVRVWPYREGTGVLFECQ